MICHRRILRGIWAVLCFGVNLIALAHAVMLIVVYHGYHFNRGCGLLEQHLRGCAGGGFGLIEYALCLSAAAVSLYVIAIQLIHLWKILMQQSLPGWLHVAKEAGLTALNPLLVSYPLLVVLAETI